MIQSTTGWPGFSRGFDSGWVGDHLAFHPPMLEAVAAATVAATHTTRLRVGFGIQYDLPIETLERWCLLGGVDGVAAELREAEADGFVLVPASPDPLQQNERLVEVRERVGSFAQPCMR